MDKDLEAIARRNQGYYRGIFRPVEREIAAEVTGHGALPDDLEGEYLHIGPNPRSPLPEAGSFLYHSFDGDGMLHAVAFRKGRAFYTNRWVQTDKLRSVQDAGGREDVFSLGQALAGKMRMDVDMDFRTAEVMGRANTNVVTHAGRIFALHEADKPYEIRASWRPEQNLRTVGRTTFGGKLVHPMTAHPRVDPQSGHMMCYGINPVESPARVHYSVINAQGEVCHHITIALPRPVMMHDMCITANYSVLFDFNFVFNMQDLFKGKPPWSHIADEPARFGILPRFAKDESEVRWFEIPPCCVFHMPGAWEEATPEGKVVVVLGNRSASPTVSDVAGKAPPEYLYEWRFNMDTGKVVSERQLTDTYMAFPVKNPALDGGSFQFVYGGTVVPHHVAIEKGWLAKDQDSFPVFDGICKVDLRAGKVTQRAHIRTRAGNEGLVCEVAYAPRRSTAATRNADEDDGYIVTYLQDPIEQTSECIVLSARDLSLVSRLGLPGRVTAGFHSEWVTPEVIRDGQDL